MKLGLDAIRTLLHALGDPQTRYTKVQVAGTNGKGSVCAFLNAICLSAGIETGLYTSPHLVSITERIRIEGTDIGEDKFALLATRVRETAEILVESGELEAVPTFFEQVTAIALLAFAEAKVEVAIIETGLGGRLDATTAANAEIAVITRIDLDHQKYLGETIVEIVAEKAAIIHAGSKVVALHQSREIDQVITGRCREVGVEPIWATNDVKTHFDPQVAGLITTFVTDTANYGNILLLGMHGRHQIENAAVAIAAAELLSQDIRKISPEAFWGGLENATHPGRLEWIDRFLLDGAHNPGGARALRDYLDEFVTAPITMIYGSMDDKNVEEIASILFPKADRLILTTPSNSRAIDADKLTELAFGRVDDSRVQVVERAAEAVEKALEVGGPKDIILVTGSLYLVGEARAILIPRYQI